MTPQEMRIIDRIQNPREILVDRILKNKADRSLVCGVMNDTSRLHIYLRSMHIYRLIYDHRDGVILTYNENIKDPEICIPRGGIRPEMSDYEFISVLKVMGMDIVFLDYSMRESDGNIFNYPIVFDNKLILM